LLVTAEVLDSIEATPGMLGHGSEDDAGQTTACDLDRWAIHSAATIDATTILLYDSLAGRMQRRTDW
jgi:hypothetical protein